MVKNSPEMAAFTEDHVSRLTSLSVRQLRYWDETGFFKPTASAAAYGRYYSFRDVVGLRTLAELRREYKVPLQYLRRVAERLAHLKDDLWSKTTLHVLGKRVVFTNPETGEAEEPITGQKVLSLPLKRVRAKAATEAKKLLQRDKRMVGQVVSIGRKEKFIAGTRIPVAAVQRLAEDGYSPEQIIAEYPDLKMGDVEAALAAKRIAA